jgi:hypothetical protein
MKAISYATYAMEKMVQIFHNYEGDEDSKFFGDRTVMDFLNTKSMITDTLQHLFTLNYLLCSDVKVWGSTKQIIPLMLTVTQSKDSPSFTETEGSLL